MTLFCTSHHLLDRAADSKLYLSQHTVYSRSTPSTTANAATGSAARTLIIASLGLHTICLLLNTASGGSPSVGSGGVSSALISSALIRRMDHTRAALFRLRERGLLQRIDMYVVAWACVAGLWGAHEIGCCAAV